MWISRLALVVLAVSLVGTSYAGSPPVARATPPGKNGRIAFVTETPNQVEGIYSMKPDGSDKKLLLEHVGAFEPRWSPDGKHIVFTGRAPSLNEDVFVIKSDGSDLRQLTDNDRREEDPSYSPDGTQIIFESETGSSGGDFDLHVISSEGGVEINVTNDQGPERQPVFSPDGKHVAFWGKIGDNHGVVVMDPDGENRKLLTKDWGIPGSWSPDGKFIAYADAQNAGGVRIIPADGGSAVPIGPSDGSFPIWSPDGSFILYDTYHPDTGAALAMHVMTSDGTFVADLGTGQASDWAVAGNGIIDSVEFTQAIQQWQSLDDLKNDLKDDGQPPIPIIAGKPAAMRVYLSQPEQEVKYDVSSNLSEYVDHTTVDPDCTPKKRRTSEDHCYSDDFDFTPPAGDWTAEVTVKDTQGQIVDHEEFPFKSKVTQPVTLMVASICDEKDATGNWLCGDPAAIPLISSFLRDLSPTATTNVVQTGLQLMVPRDPDADTWRGLVMDALEQAFQSALFRGQLPADEEDIYVGAIRPEVQSYTPDAAGWARQPGHEAAVIESNSGDRSEVLAHEVGHALGAHHTNNVVPADHCTQSVDDDLTSPDAWPYADNYLRSGPPPGDIDVGLSGIGQPLPGDQNFELMSYCYPKWVSQHTYLVMMNRLASAAASSESMTTIATGDFWLVSGSVTASGLKSFAPVQTFIDASGPSDQGSGDYSLEVRGDGDAVLFKRSFDIPKPSAATHEDMPTSPFNQFIPVQTGAKSIVLLHGAADLGTIELGGSAPSVAFNATPSTVGGKQSVSWTINDPDSAVFTSYLDYSYDGGTSWHTIVGGLPDDNVSLDFDSMSGSANAMLRVRVTDGVNSGQATTAPFSVATKEPQVMIISPSNDRLARSGQTVDFEASASDPEDGALSGDALQWISSLDGSLGTGQSLHISSLSIGTQTITLTARDSDNNTVTKSISVYIWDAPLIDEHPDGDANCDGEVTSADALSDLRHVAGVDAIAPSGCEDINQHGDTNCDNAATIADAINIVRFVAEGPPPPAAGCRPVGI